ncbi:hypothetical protein AB0B66_09155 [Catellatospora sp. NPDC049111]|uniref:TRAFAC clade GTPase domain-containing protein n=1 Tax=Catellatospora sp. NPDC049111 TaxID=3155271 RepID=UPI003410D08E
MPYVLAIGAIAVGVGLYFWLCLIVVTAVSLPIVLVGVPLAMLAGAGLAFTRATGVLRGNYPKTTLVTPQHAAAAATARNARRRRRKYVPVDVAWPHYFAAQIMPDCRAIAGWVAADIGSMWRGTTRPLTGDGKGVILVFWPFTLMVPVLLAAGTAGALFGVAVVFMTGALLTAVGWLVGAAAIFVTRAIVTVWQSVFRARASCPSCFAVTRLPAYRCPGAHPGGDNLHRSLLPGRLGIWWRRCTCGTRLPTTVIRARRLQAVCQRCNHPLHAGAGMARDVRIPVFGAASAGKTHLIMGGLVALHGQNELGVRVASADHISERTFEGYRQVVSADGAAAKTPVDRAPFAVTTRIEKDGPWPQTLVHVFDASGEALVSPTRNADFSYLDFARTLLFVLDPFSIPDVRDQLTLSFKELVPTVNAALLDPEESYNGTVNRLRGYGVKTGGQRLAFVLSKADLLVRLPIGEDLSVTRSESAAVRRWLCARRLENLVDTAEKDFGEVRFFFVSAKDTTRHGALQPFSWLLESDGLSLA